MGGSNRQRLTHTIDKSIQSKDVNIEYSTSGSTGQRDKAPADLLSIILLFVTC